MTWQNPLWLLLLLLCPLVLLHSRVRGLPLSTFALLVPGRRANTRQYLIQGCRLLALASLIIGLAGPQLPGGYREEKVMGIDLLLALDVSGTMQAEDFQPHNRLYAAKQVLREFIGRNREQRMGLVAFAGQSLTLCPLTTDSEALLDTLEEVDFGIIPQDGTAIGDAIANSIYRLKGSQAKSKVIVLLTDGQNNAGQIQPEGAAAIARDRGIRIYTIAMGKPGGAPIPYVNPLGIKSYLKTKDGRVFLTYVDEAPLIKIAKIARGKAYRAIDTQSLEDIYRQISHLERSIVAKTRHPMKKEVGIWFFGLALAFVLGEFALSTGRWRVLHV